MAIGRLIVIVYVDNIAQPISGANVNIVGENTNINVVTDESGKTNEIELAAPDIEYSLEPQDVIRPFSEYTVTVTKEGLEPSVVSGVQIFSDIVSYQDVFLIPHWVY